MGFTMNLDQKAKLDEFLAKNDISELSLSVELNKRQQKRAEQVLERQISEYKPKYCGKFFRAENDGVDIYYKVIAPFGAFLGQVSCISFGLNPAFEKFNGEEIILTENTEFWSGSVYVSELDKAEEISGAEFSSAIREWVDKVLKLEWSV